MASTPHRLPPAAPAMLAALVIACIGLGLTAPVAGAAPLTREVLPVFSLSCTELPGPGVATLFADEQGPERYASTALWAPGASPETDPPLLVSGSSTLSRDGDEVAGSFELVDYETGEPAGGASFEAVLAPVGEPWVSDASPERSGNVIDRSYRSERLADVSGWLRLPDGTERPLEGCTGSVGEIVLVRNTPQKVVEHLEAQSFGYCETEGAGGHTLMLLLLSEHAETFAELVVLPPGADEPTLFGFGDADLGRRTLTGTLDLYDAWWEPAGGAAIDATVVTLGPRVEKGQEGDLKYKLFAKDWTLTGGITVDGVGAFSLDGACTGAHQRGWLQYPNPGI